MIDRSKTAVSEPKGNNLSMTEQTLTKKNKGGRPPVIVSGLDITFHKLEPYLKTGKTLNKACILAKISKSSVYKYYGLNEEFTEKIDVARAYTSVLVNDNFFSRLVDVSKRISKTRELRIQLENKRISEKKYREESSIYDVTEKDWDFLKWYAVNSHSTRDEYGTRVEITGKDSKPELPQELFEPKPMETVLATYEIVRNRMSRVHTDKPCLLQNIP
ncbi:hypothetical protein A2627_01455 [Candidatus Woesebacteria bacterium RIFCSPHIGHO2_01_FULL_39_28]|uniref:Uncharacterized protein n=1 Tax=Candidatus Woesebacteria bacterium RIFCSPHIGHO2_01_FULL_39_28 TaxID=1802496 RepID=A0A1F7YHD5_9BACT|nr:MAG: hypothetical protein A2627_01455 [Candidatus Woesebacteria bacterium RIFCSPHIGHO2_01_FULL_39_28]OGM57629.1 MAG: hypothetical protein A3A50_01315 [Candidatus Woesebacteria bacterium RIFCSPLOWO2_01_FULL_38_20]